MVILKETNVAPFRRIAVAFSVFPCCTMPEFRLRAINYAKAVWLVQDRIIGPRRRCFIGQDSVHVGFNAQHLVLPPEGKRKLVAFLIDLGDWYDPHCFLWPVHAP